MNVIYLFEITGESTVPFAKIISGNPSDRWVKANEFAKTLLELHQKPIKFWVAEPINAITISK